MSAQDTITTGTKNHLFKANLLFTPSLDYEKGITKNSTLGFRLGTELLFAENNNTQESEFAGLFATLTPYYRYYHNFKRRIKKGKNIANNSANYFAVNVTYIYTESAIFKRDITFNDNYIWIPNITYGLQRTYWKRLNFGVELGVGYSFSNIEEKVWPILHANLGWVFGN